MYQKDLIERNFKPVTHFGKYHVFGKDDRIYIFEKYDEFLHFYTRMSEKAYDELINKWIEEHSKANK
jgi:hypothetical protein